eukprot:scaffold18337_cov49-Attheya_sp.AAC.1
MKDSYGDTHDSRLPEIIHIIMVRSLTDFDAKSSSVLLPFFGIRLCILSVEPTIKKRPVVHKSDMRVLANVPVNDDRRSSPCLRASRCSFQKAESGRGH